MTGRAVPTGVGLCVIGLALVACGVGRVAEPTDVVQVAATAATTGPPAGVLAAALKPVEVPPPTSPRDAPSTNPTAATTVSDSTPGPTPSTPAVPAEAGRAPTAAPATGPAAAAHAYTFPAQSDSCWYPSSHHDYPAADIFCPIGTPFVAVVDGVVDFVSREDLYAQGLTDPVNRGGLSVAIVGDDGVRYYGSHLSEVSAGIAPGARVTVGQLLGLTGDTGNAKGTDPHVHFGISHPTTADDWMVRRGEVWPQDYLTAWRRGEDVTPTL